MPTQEYHCNADGPFDVHLTFAEDVARTLPCPTCGADSRHVLRAPAAKFEYTWNDQANEYQRDPYTQAKAQAWNNYNEKRDMGIRLEKPTEADLQIAAEAVDHGERHPPPSAKEQQISFVRKKARTRKKKIPA